MLKIKDNVDLKELEKRYGLYKERIMDDYDFNLYFDLVYDRDGVFISQNTNEIYGRDNDTLDLLYDLIKADLVEKVSDDND